MKLSWTAFANELLFQRLQESLTKTSPTLDREAEYVKTLKVCMYV